MTLRKQLKEQAEILLSQMQADLQSSAITIVDATGSNIEARDLLKYVASDRNASLGKKLVSVLLVDAEAELLKVWNDQQELAGKDGETL